MKKFFFYATVACIIATFAACSNDEKSLPERPGVIQGDTENVCPALTVELTIGTIADAASYQWYKDGTAISSATTTTYLVTESGTYTVSGVNAFGEGAKSAPHAVAIYECPTPSSLVGRWDFNDVNAIGYLNGVSYNFKEEGYDLTELKQMFIGVYLVFTAEEVTISLSGFELFSAPYTATTNTITAGYGFYSLTCPYSLSGNSLELTGTRDMLEMLLMGALPMEFYSYDDVDFIMLFDKVN